ncbi:Hypothetical protein D9617_2g054470 [Elsinoe fawcettii]|nr:Hypothetical protein D9617_2g054470 [Elsinoe fawcettii]
MYTITFLTTALLSSVALAAPAPQAPSQTYSTNDSSANTATAFTASMTAPRPSFPGPAPGSGLSLTAQLTLADSAVDRFLLLPKDEQFVFNFDDLTKKGLGGKGGDLVAANRKTFPALVSTGAGMAVGFLGPCGFNTPHVHPRSVELQIVTEGRLVTEMVPENGVLANGKRRVIRNTLEKNQMTPFYQGSVHTQFNPDCDKATFVAAFNNEDFSAGQIPDELFALGDDVISAAFGQAIAGEDVAKFRKAIPTSIALGVEECLVKCGIQKK